MSEQTITLCGVQWTRVPNTLDKLLHEDDRGAPTIVSRDTLERLERERRAEAERSAKIRREREAREAELDAQPVIRIVGIDWVRDPRDPALLVSVDRQSVLSERKVREIEAEREREAAVMALRHAAGPSSLEQRIAELERALAAAVPAESDAPPKARRAARG